MISAKTNINSINAQNSYQVNYRDMSKSLERLATGSRINRSGDDAAGLALSTGFVSQIFGNQQAINNLNDATGLVQTADSTIRNVTEVLQRMRELSVQASNDTYSDSDRVLMNNEFKQMEEEINRIISQTKWNKMNLFDASNASNANAIDINIGYLQQGQEFSLLLYNQQGSSGDYQDLNFFIDGEAVSATNATGSKFLAKQKSSKQSVIEPLPNRISGKLCHYIKMV